MAKQDYCSDMEAEVSPLPHSVPVRTTWPQLHGQQDREAPSFGAEDSTPADVQGVLPGFP